MSAVRERPRVVVCVADETVYGALHQAVVRAALFDVVARATDETELLALLDLKDPDLLIIDEAIATDGDVGKLVASSRPGRMMPALVLVETETPWHHGHQGEDRRGYLGKDVLVGGGLVGSSQVFARLVAAGGLVRTRKRTQTANSLMEAIRRERVKHRHVDQRPEVLTLASWPLDMVVLAGGTGSRDVLDILLPRVPVLPVPALVAVPGAELPAAAAWAKAKPPVLMLDSEVELRRASGYVVVAAGGEAKIEEERVVVRRGTGNVDGILDTIASAGRLRSGGLTILLSGEDTELAMALAAPVNEGGIAAVVHPDQTDAPAAGAAALEWGLVALALTIDEIAWILSRTIPRRT